MAYVLALITPLLMGGMSIGAAIQVAVLMWVGFVITTLIMNHRYEGMKWSLTVIDGLHILGVLVIQGVVLGIFG